jgi:hypothetical protein
MANVSSGLWPEEKRWHTAGRRASSRCSPAAGGRLFGSPAESVTTKEALSWLGT